MDSNTIDECAVVHIHFGMSGQFRTMKYPSTREPTSTTRLRMINTTESIEAHLSAMTVGIGTVAFYYEKIMKLGPDPLREDAEIELVWESLQKSKRSIGYFLMDQSKIAGIGNIYRAEILFKAGIHPDRECSSLSRQEFDAIWFYSVQTLQKGFVRGSIISVDDKEAVILGKPWTRRYIYNHAKCGRCGSGIKSWLIASRTAYACEQCQPKVGADGAGVNRKDDVKLFKSRCAPEGEVVLEKAGADERYGLKVGTLHLLKESVVVGEDDLGIVNAKEAKKEKIEVGEGLGVEHVAWVEEEVLERNEEEIDLKLDLLKSSRQKRKRAGNKHTRDSDEIAPQATLGFKGRKPRRAPPPRRSSNVEK
mmetsp:Transcript_10090/g.18175  ORF Transcript_10090/g.18175 Transcript_10090/m.18175 type:complete len:364 (-) Transcript_10090:993-2084(-)